MVIKKDDGFTLMEVIVVVAIIAILASIALPQYNRYQINAHRADVQSEMMRVAQRLQSYHLVNHSYTGATLTGIGGTVNYPGTGPAFYEISLAVDADNQGYTLIAEPNANSVQADNGFVCINQEAQKFWALGATACALSATSNWDGK